MAADSDEFGTTEVLGNEPPGRRFPRSLVLAGVSALVLITGGGVAAAALSPSPAPTPSAGGTATETPSATPPGKAQGHGWGWGRKPGMRMGMGMGMGGAIHGEYTVPNGQGGYVTVATQYGDVTAVDQSSITVKSEDGYTKKYAVNGDTRVNAGREGISSVKAGDKVMVNATVTSGTATAVSIFDGTRPAMPRWRDHGGRGPGFRGHQPDQAPSPGATPSSTSTA